MIDLIDGDRLARAKNFVIEQRINYDDFYTVFGFSPPVEIRTRTKGITIPCATITPLRG